MAFRAVPPLRVFKTKAFARLAAKALFQDADLCSAMLQVIAGQVEDLGGGVYKKRFGRNLYRQLKEICHGR